MTLSDDPILGSWVIKALVNDKLQQKSFKVDEYGEFGGVLILLLENQRRIFRSGSSGGS